ncbi:MAG TPA: hypothetical protein VHE56_00660 [Mycobacteriales bacterium]|nr:hypothetical protein [Mycobacteriales bacterium]
MRLCSDEGAIGVPGIVKIGIALAVFGLLGYDTFFTIATHLKAEDVAQNAAYAGSQAWDATSGSGDTHNAATAYDGVIQYLLTNEPAKCRDELTSDASQAVPATIPAGCDYVCTGAKTQAPICGSHGTFMVDSDGMVHLVIRREAETLVFKHLGFMHSMLTAYEHGDASTDQS